MKGGTLFGISPANWELAEEINIIPTFSLRSCSSSQGQGKLRVRATSGTSSVATLSSPSLPSCSPSQRRLGSPTPVLNPWKSSDSPKPGF